MQLRVSCNRPQVNLVGVLGMYEPEWVCMGVECVPKMVWVCGYQVFRPMSCDQVTTNFGPKNFCVAHLLPH